MDEREEVCEIVKSGAALRSCDVNWAQKTKKNERHRGEENWRGRLERTTRIHETRTAV